MLNEDFSDNHHQKTQPTTIQILQSEDSWGLTSLKYAPKFFTKHARGFALKAVWSDFEATDRLVMITGAKQRDEADEHGFGNGSKTVGMIPWRPRDAW